MVAFIKRGPGLLGLFPGPLLCELPGGQRYHRKTIAYLKDEKGHSGVFESEGWAKFRYRFTNSEPDLIYRFRLFKSNTFESEGWSSSINRLDTNHEEYRCGQFTFLCDRESEMIRLEIIDPAWTLRNIVIGFHLYERCFPSSDAQ